MEEVVVLFKVNHIAIIVKDLEKTIDFYNTLFHFKYDEEIEYPTFKVVFLKSEFDETVKLELVLLNAQDKSVSSGVIDHFCFETDAFDQFIETIKLNRYIEKNPSVSINSIGIRSIFITGINNERIQILEQRKQ